MHTRILSMIALLLFFAGYVSAQDMLQEQDIVLVTSAESSFFDVDEEGEISLAISPLSSLEIRKLFLGLPVTRQNALMEPMVYEPNDHMGEIFLKAIVGMTARAYNRKMLQARLSAGGALVPVYEDIQTLIDGFERSSNTVSFVTYKEAMEHDLRVVQVLWLDRN